uniref:SdrD B-like domain-containing protein n=1 Tax=Parerythrobacter lutipelagi TaxID=1964208 RepID=UPI0010F5C6B8|nr:SdrD B-like domain-containing protein [Parerythrobacter lutipelagi]
MTRTRARNVGTVALGTVLLGLGCSQRDQTDSNAGLAFPEEEASDPGAVPRKQGYPEPEFGPVARRAIKQREIKEPAIGRMRDPVAPAADLREQGSLKDRKRALLETTSDRTLVAVEPKPVTGPAALATAAPPDDNPAPPSPLAEAAAPGDGTKVPESVLEAEGDFVAAFAAAKDAAGDPGEHLAEPAPSSPAGIAQAPDEAIVWPEVDFTPETKPAQNTSEELAAISLAGESAADEEAPALSKPASGDPQSAQASSPPVYAPPSSTPPQAETLAIAEVPANPPLRQDPDNQEPSQTGSSSTVNQAQRVNPPAESSPEPISQSPVEAPMQAPAQSDEQAFAAAPPSPASQAVYADVIDQTSFVPPSALPADDDATVRRRTIDRGATAQAAQGRPAEEAPAIQPSTVPELASVVPPRRSPIPMTTATTPQPDAAELEAANDTGINTTQASSAASTSELLPAARSQPTLGLNSGGADQRPDPAAAGMTESRQSGFTASAQPPALSYQDELILELKVKDVEAADTIIAYGTRSGVYLPLGTLARILDLAIVVSDDGHYANGWVLEEDQTLTIDLRQGILVQRGEETPLAPDAAAAFEGDLYVRDSQFEQLMPLRIKTDLRSQAVLVETLQPFPFEERMKREADRRRLANRASPNTRQTWPREDTPYRAATLPLADIELRALSDSAFGPRLETDIQLANDLGFLTAQVFFSADTERGLTASLIELGRMDPDAELLGPLAATEFAVGDVSTTSMPIGLRSVSGRGISITNSPPETFSVFEKIDLRGILQEGYEVELYRNEILIGSTRERVNGQYEFLQVPVDFGLNAFRLVFFGPQGQRSEQVRRITVGDGRLPEGKLVYRFGAVQKDENVLGIRNPDFIPAQDFGAWRASGELAYGLTSDITALVSGAWFETAIEERWVASAGVRTGLGRFAIKGDLAAASGGAFAVSGGIGGRFGNSAVTVSHAEYSGNFIDETRSVGSEFLRRATEIDFNSSLNLGDPVSGLTIPLTARIRHTESAAGRAQTNAALRASARLPHFLVSNTLEYSRSSVPGLSTQSQLFGNFDLATATRSKTRGRLSLGYQIVPDPDLVSAAVEVDRAIDSNTAIRGSVGYSFTSKSAQVGLSAVRDFDRFTAALDGSYGFRDDTYSIGLRLGLSFGRDPLRGNFFIARPGLATSGGVSARAFRDMDGDGAFGPGDSVLPEVDFAAYNQTATTGGDGIARLAGLGEGRGVSIQVDTSTLPDIDLAAIKPGIEVVPRPGRIHAADFPIVSVSEVDGTVTFRQEGRARGVSGVRLLLKDTNGKVVKYARTEVEGYYFFERVLPGSYTITLEPDQSAKLNLCAQQDYTLNVGFEADLISKDIDIALCN